MHDLQLANIRLQRPRTLGGLIAIHESNFLRLQRLIPDLDALEGTFVSRVAGALDLYLSILERHKYTTTICLTYRFEPEQQEDEEDYVFEPRARIRIYHDARAVEVIGHCRRKISHKVHRWRRGQMPELDRKWELNRFLQKWLGFCHRQGHLFLRCTAQPLDVSPFFISANPKDLPRHNSLRSWMP